MTGDTVTFLNVVRLVGVLYIALQLDKASNVLQRMISGAWFNMKMSSY